MSPAAGRTELFDTHLHLSEMPPGTMFAAARAAGVEHFLVAGGDLAESQRAVVVAGAEPGVWAAVGVHPHVAAGFDGDLGPFRDLAHDGRVVAIGEVGLDYFYNHSPRAQQQRGFATFLGLAAELALPVIVHCRDAYEDCLTILRQEWQPTCGLLIHSFTGTPEWAERFLGLGAYLSFNGIVTFPKAENVRAALRVVPLDRLLAETDSPYLAPPPHRGKPNQPAYVIEVVRRLATERGVSFEEMAGLTTANGLRFFSAGNARP